MQNNKCEFDHIFIEQFIDGELSYEESAEVSSHIEKCASCKSFYTQTKSIKNLFRNTFTEEHLSSIERSGFEKLIDESDNPKGIFSVLNFLKRLFTSNRFFITAGTAAFGVMIFALIINIDTIDQDKILVSEVLSIHKNSLPCDMCNTENIEKLVKANLNIVPKIKKFISAHPGAKGRFSHIGSVPVASIELTKNDAKGTLLVSGENKNLKKVFKDSKCIEELHCKAKEQSSDKHNMIFWEKGKNNYLFVSDNNDFRKDMVRLISAE